MSSNKPYKATDQKWTVWDAPDDPFQADKEYLRFAIELPKYVEEMRSTTAVIRPSLTFTHGNETKFTCVYEMEYDVTLTDAPITTSLLSELIVEDCYPAFVKAFDEQKKEFDVTEYLKSPPMDAEIKKAVSEGARKALLDSGFL